MFLQIMLDNSQTKVQIPYEKSLPMVFYLQIYSYAMDFMGREAGRKKLNNVQNAVNSKLTGMAG